MATYSTCIKQSSANQLVFPLHVDPSEYDFLTFGFYQNSRCIAMYTSTDTEYVDLSNEGEVRIYMLASVAKRFGPQRVSYETTTWKDSESKLVVGCSSTLDVHISNNRCSVVDTDDTEIRDPRLNAHLERLINKFVELNVNAMLDIDDNGYLYLTQADSTEESDSP